ncbi:MAG: two-component system, cell cycle response regulator [Verrucomicrobiota bacterium]|jgi:DNA-binding response OmpR family regulator
MKILVADDDNTSRLLLAATLRRLGHEVFEAKDGQEALGEWEVNGQQLLIIDWIMPVLNGLEVCRKIRAHTPKQRCHVTLLTVRAGTADQLEAREAGVDDFIVKPFEKEQIAAHVQLAARSIGLHETSNMQTS